MGPAVRSFPDLSAQADFAPGLGKKIPRLSPLGRARAVAFGVGATGQAYLLPPPFATESSVCGGAVDLYSGDSDRASHISPGDRARGLYKPSGAQFFYPYPIELAPT